MMIKARLMILAGIAMFASHSISAHSTIANVTQSENQTTEISKEDVTRASKALGHVIGRNLKTPALQFDVDAMIEGIREGSSGKPAPMSDKEYEQLMAKIQEHALQSMAKDNLAAANEFLIKNVKENGIVVIEPNKLQYTIIKEGSGPVVGSHSSPKVNYTGKFIDGTAFGSSEEAGGPITIPLDQTIKGFSLGIAGMKEGEQRRLFVHPDLGYGTSGHLPPNSLLIFDIEVVKADNPGHNSLEGDTEDDDSDLEAIPSAPQDNKTKK